MEEKEKKANVDVVDTPEEQSEMEHMAEVRDDENERPVTEEPQTQVKEEELVSLLEDREAEKFRSQWLEIQSRFVDDPRASVKEADELVADVIKSITRNFADRRMSLEDQWNSEDERVSTEDLRIAIKSYRSFFNRLLTLKS